MTSRLQLASARQIPADKKYTRACRHALQLGGCQYEGKCTFAHSAKEFRVTKCHYDEYCYNEKCPYWHSWINETNEALFEKSLQAEGAYDLMPANREELEAYIKKVEDAMEFLNADKHPENYTEADFEYEKLLWKKWEEEELTQLCEELNTAVEAKMSQHNATFIAVLIQGLE